MPALAAGTSQTGCSSRSACETRAPCPAGARVSSYLRCSFLPRNEAIPPPHRADRPPRRAGLRADDAHLPGLLRLPATDVLGGKTGGTGWLFPWWSGNNLDDALISSPGVDAIGEQCITNNQDAGSYRLPDYTNFTQIIDAENRFGIDNTVFWISFWQQKAPGSTGRVRRLLLQRAARRGEALHRQPLAVRRAGDAAGGRRRHDHRLGPGRAHPRGDPPRTPAWRREHQGLARPRSPTRTPPSSRPTWTRWCPTSCGTRCVCSPAPTRAA